MRLFIFALCAAAAFASTAGAQPAAASSSEDARCLLDMVALTNASDPDAQHAGQDGVVFFTGRISARDPGFDFSRLKAMAQGMNPQTAGAELQQKCGPLVQRYMQQVEAALSGPPAPPAAK